MIESSPRGASDAVYITNDAQHGDDYLDGGDGAGFLDGGISAVPP